MQRENGVPKPYPPYWFGFNLALVMIIAGCASWVFYVSMLRNYYGEVWPDRGRVDRPAVWRNGLKVTLLDQACPGEDIASDIEAWSALFGEAGLSFQTASTMTSAGDSPVGVLVVPSASCMPPEEKRAVLRWLGDGGGLVVTGALDYGRESGQLENQDFWKVVAGVEATHTVAVKSPAYFTLASQLPVGMGLPPGERWRIQYGVRIAAKARSVDGYWADDRMGVFEGEPFNQMTAITHRASGEGRVVWIGSGINAVGRSERNRPSWEKLFLNSVRWAGRRPLAAVSNWPGGLGVAVVVAQEVRDGADLPDAVTMARAFHERQIPATFFVGMSQNGSSERVRELSRQAEVAALGPLGSAPEQAERQDLQGLRERLQGASQGSIRGFSVGNATVNVKGNRLRILAETGYNYFLAEPMTAAAAPTVMRFSESILFPLDGRVLVGLPRYGVDDFSVLSRYSGDTYSEQSISDVLWDDFVKAQRVGGLYVLHYRTDLLGGPETRPAVLHLLERMQTPGTWLASASDVAEWWVQRDKISVEIVKLSQQRMRIAVSNGGLEDVENALVHVALPYIPKRLSVTPVVFGGQRVAHEILSDREILQVRIGKLKAQSNQTWVIDVH